MSSKKQHEDLRAVRERLRHSASHLMADAVLQIFPEAKLAIGPPTEDGFYYDFQVSRPFTPEDLESIDTHMAENISLDVRFERLEISREDARILFADQPFKMEIIEDLPDSESISVYQHGEFKDLCQGPHVVSAGEITAYKLVSVAGAYWRGDEKRPMLQRIYGTAFETTEALDEHLSKLNEASLRDHRRLGRELDLYMFDPIAPAR